MNLCVSLTKDSNHFLRTPMLLWEQEALASQTFKPGVTECDVCSLKAAIACSPSPGDYKETISLLEDEYFWS